MIRLAYLSAVAAAAASLPAIAAMPITGPLVGADNAALGTVTVTDAPGGVLVRIEATGLPPGWHAVHFHEKGTCGDAGFKASGGHVHAGKTPPVHGLLNPSRSDSGDLTNFFVAADGTAKAEIYSTLVSIKGAAGRPALADADGSAVVVHANADDYRTQPIGGAGDRIGCAVVK